MYLRHNNKIVVQLIFYLKISKLYLFINFNDIKNLHFMKLLIKYVII